MQAEKAMSPKIKWTMLSLRNFKNRRQKTEQTLENKAKTRERRRSEGLLTPNMG
jgi:hypothetical protein